MFIFIFFSGGEHIALSPFCSTFPLPLTFPHASVTSRHVAQSRLDDFHRAGSFAVAWGYRYIVFCVCALIGTSRSETSLVECQVSVYG